MHAAESVRPPVLSIMSNTNSSSLVLLSGGVGGAKLVDGFARRAPRRPLDIIGNVGDDVEQHGLWVSPDLDIVTYTLAGLVDDAKGWGIEEDTFHALAMLKRLGEDVWMNLGDRDLATHIYRTKQRRAGVRPTLIALEIARRLGVEQARVLPPTDDFLQTIVETDGGAMNFQEYYLKARCAPEPRDVRFDGADQARSTPEVREAVASAGLIVFAPSNPVASIGPILAVQGVRDALATASATRVAVSPLVGGQSLKGPSDRMMRAKGYSVDPVGVARYYEGLIDALVIDESDRAHTADVEAMGLRVLVTRTVMKSGKDRVRLAGEIAEWGCGGC